MGWVAFRLGRIAEAEQFLAMAWAMDNNPEIAAHLGEVLWVQGRKEEAREIWRQGQSVDESNQALQETMSRLDDGL
jgi:predicted negative regulator of RcsB-dependent stress response